jgi:Zn-dependent protease with chaperone function/protocatechuate 3,4-dioxygenase beta subunit
MNASITAVAASLAGWLADFYLLATLLLLLAFVGWRSIRQPVHRLTVAWAVMIELALLAAICASPAWPRLALTAAAPEQTASDLSLPATSRLSEVPPRPQAVAADMRYGGPLMKTQETGGHREAKAPASPEPPVSFKPRLAWTLPSLRMLIAGAFLTGLALEGLWLALGAAGAWRLCWQSVAAPASLRRELAGIVRGSDPLPRVLLSPRIGNAVALGVLRPTILLPATLAQEGPPQAVRAVLAHEWAHIRNRDLWLLALGRCLLTLLFAHPLYWWLRRRIRDDQEAVADAVAAQDDRQDYAERLLDWLKMTVRVPRIRVSGAVGIREGSSQLSRRIAMLLDDTFRVKPSGSRRWQYRAVGLTALLALAISMITLRPGPTRGDEPAPRVAVEVRMVSLSDSFYERPGPDSGIDTQIRGAATLETVRLPKVGSAVVLGPQEAKKLLEMAQGDRRSNVQAPQTFMVPSGQEKRIADFGAPSAELRLEPGVPHDRRTIPLGVSFGVPGNNPLSLVSVREDVPDGSSLLVSVGETVSEGRVEWGVPILRDIPYLKRYFRTVGIGRERTRVLLILTARVVASEEPAAQAAGESKPGEGLTYTGKVTDKVTGKPIAGATVTVRRAISSDSGHRTIQETKHETDAEGKYTFTVPPEQVAERFLYIELDVTHPQFAAKKGFGYALSMIRKNEKLGERPFFENIALIPGEELSGTIVTPEGTPAGGIVVLGFSMLDRNDFESWSFNETKTDDKGFFRLMVAKGGDAVFWPLPEKYAPCIRYPEKKRGDEGRIVLEKGVVLQGRAVDEKGSPVAGVWVNAWLHGGPAMDNVTSLVVGGVRRTALTNQQGEFRMNPLPVGEYLVRVENYPGDHLNRDRTRRIPPAVFVEQKVELRQGETSQSVEVRAVPHVVIEGQYYTSDGKPRTGHGIMIFGELGDGYYIGNAWPDGNGKIVAKAPKGLKAARLDLTTNEHSALRWRKSKDAPLSNSRQAELGTVDADIRGIEIIRYEAPIVLVKAVAEDGSPVKNFKVTADYPLPKDKTTGFKFIVDGLNSDVTFEKQEDGRRRSEQLLPDEEFTLTVHADGFKPKSQKLKLPEGAVKELEVKLEKQ